MAISVETYRMSATALGLCTLYVIAYREANPIEIVAIVHGARHLEAFLQNGSPTFLG